ncbi:hypothetical protein [Picosynechococcus sp. PCC 8807]|uniref:hypothetical protein n=1 Tax=Picosynechococcus sp. PCC 8807 TaxID=195248 RepID=UPI000810B9EE|nr:hypothetical protein [Picosynechococcus sp. PCC 8807]ANV90878.1 hypothetical protein AWQ24_09670 [Picosynechococcus sp. PCC 8807]
MSKGFGHQSVNKFSLSVWQDPLSRDWNGEFDVEKFNKFSVEEKIKIVAMLMQLIQALCRHPDLEHFNLFDDE